MNDTRQSRVVMVLAANLTLSALIGFSIWNGGAAAQKGGSGRAPGTGGALRLKSDSGVYPATTRSEAAAEAKQLAGRSDPVSPVATSAYPARKSPAREKHLADSPSKNLSELEKADSFPAISKNILAVPPPPPMPVERHPAPSFSQLKYTAPGKMAGITVTAVIGNKAMLSLRREGSRKSERPEIICLAAGEQVRTWNNVPVSVVSVEPYRVTLDVDGDRFVRSLPEIR